MSASYRIVDLAVACDWKKIHAFAVRPENLPRWASGLADGISRTDDGHWVAKSPMGDVTIDMAIENEWGVMDHVVTLPSGQKVYNAFRVSPDGDGAVLGFVVLRAEGADDEAFEADVDHVRRDLTALKELAESGRF